MSLLQRAADAIADMGNISRRTVIIAAVVLAGAVLGGLVLLVPLNYLVFLLGGLVFAYLVIARMEAAIVVALLIQYQLARFNYMGGDTPFHPNGVMGLALIAGAAFYFLTHKVIVSRFTGVGGFLVFLAISAISLVNAGEYLMESVGILLRLVAAFSIFVVLLQKLETVRQVKWVIGAIIAAQLVPTIIGLIIVAGKSGLFFTDDTMRLGNSGVGVYLSVISILCMVFLLDAKTTTSRILWGILSAFFLVGLFFSYGRSGWIGFGLSMVVISFVRFKKLLFIIPLALILVVLFIPAISQRFADISLTETDDPNADSTFAQRLEYWQAALEIYPNHPLLGVGYGIGRYHVGEYRGKYPHMIHNDYIAVLLETGIIGLFAFLFWQFQWARQLIKTYRAAPPGFEQTASFAIFVAFLATLVMRLSDNIVLDSFDMYPLCALTAAILAIPRIRNDETKAAGLTSQKQGNDAEPTN